MDHWWDFVEVLGQDTSISVFTLLDDPADLVRLSSVSRSWRRFVVANGFSKSLCLTRWPELSNFTRVVEVGDSVEAEAANAESSSSAEWENLEREHRIYAYLNYCIDSPMAKRDCILAAISASSTDNYPDESIDNTLQPGERVHTRPSYWSSKGEKDPRVSEMLTYKLCSKLSVIDEIRIQPFRAFFQYGFPIYSAKSVRFRMGWSSLHQEQGTGASKHAAGHSADNYIWTYVSPEFEMAQENILQSFKLPRPAVCIGGVVQIELMGRVQRQEMDDQYYICLESTRNTSAMIGTLSKTRGMSSKEAEAMGDCIESLGDSVEELKQSLKTMRELRGKDVKLHMNDIQTWVSSALTEENTCMDGFTTNGFKDGTENMVRSYIVKVAHLTSNALALINGMAGSL